MKIENNIEKFFRETNGDFKEFSKKYLNYFSDLSSKVDLNHLEKLKEVVFQARERGSNIFIIGNGGSGSTASHFDEDLALGTKTPAYYEKPFRTISLTNNTAYMLAIANDEGFENVFASQLRQLFRDYDALIAFSASGNSPNLIKAVNYANQKKGDTFGIIGFDGGKLKEVCRNYLIVPTPQGEYGPVESVHLAIHHLIVNYAMLYIDKK